SALRGSLPASGAVTVCVESIGRSDERPRAGASGANVAYVIFTSGSTGRPKGVMIEHRNVANFFVAMDARLGTTPGIWLAVTSISFDISVLELFWTLARGFTVVINQAGEAGGQGSSICEQMLKHGVTHFQCTPSLAGKLIRDARAPEALGQLRKLLIGGEAFPAA